MLHRLNASLTTSLAVVAVAFGASFAHAVPLIDTNGFEPGGSPETYAGLQTNGSDGRNLVGQNNWVAFDSLNSIAVTRDREIDGVQSLRAQNGTRGASREFSVTPDAAGTDVTVQAKIGNTDRDDTGFGDLAITTGTGGFDLLRIRRSGGVNDFEGFAANSSLVEVAGDDISLGPDGTTAYEVALTLRYNPGTNDDQVRLQYREIGATTWNNLSPVAGATLDAEGFADLGYDAPSGTLYVTVQANIGDGFRSSVRLDDVLVTTTVIPEPGSMLLLGMGGVLLLARGRRAGRTV